MGRLLKEAEKPAGKPAAGREKFPLEAARRSIYNTSPMAFSKLRSSDIGGNPHTDVQSFSRDAREG